MSAKTTRWLDLVAFLLNRRAPVTRDRIFQRVFGYGDPTDDSHTARESRRRKFERDKDELRALGIDIATVPLPQTEGDETAVGYRLNAPGFYLPYFELAGQEIDDRPYPGLPRFALTQNDVDLLDRVTQRIAERTEFPLADAARSVRLKLGFDLPLTDRNPTTTLAERTDADHDRCLAALQDAVGAGRTVSCEYYGIGRDETRTRTIDPYGLFFNWGRWYLVGQPHDAESVRVFRVDRMRDVALAGSKSSPHERPPDFDIRTYLGRAPWELSSATPTTVRVAFTFPESRSVTALVGEHAVRETGEDGGATLEFAVRDRPPFLRWLLTFRDRARVVEPSSVAAELQTMRDQVRALYDEPAE